jgi:hypothetical protein
MRHFELEAVLALALTVSLMLIAVALYFALVP